MSKGRFYQAGPMSSIPLYNFPAFIEITADLRSQGYEIYSPAEGDLKLGVDPTKPLDSPENSLIFNMRETVRRDLREILRSEGIILMPGWQQSYGCKVELMVTMWAGLKVFQYIDGKVCVLPNNIDPQVVL